MAAVAARPADRVVISDDKPRSDDPAAIAADIMEGSGDAAAEVIHDRAAAIARALQAATAGDVVLIAGKGHETYQQIGTQYLPFSDQAVVARLLSGGRPCAACGSARRRRQRAAYCAAPMPSSHRSVSTAAACKRVISTWRSRVRATTAMTSSMMRRRRARWRWW